MNTKSEKHTVKYYYEFLKALRDQLKFKPETSVSYFVKSWRMPPSTSVTLKNLGWLSVNKNALKKTYYQLLLKDIEPWHGKVLYEMNKKYYESYKTKTQSINHIGTEDNNNSNPTVLFLQTVSTEQIVQELENRNYIVELKSTKR